MISPAYCALLGSTVFLYVLMAALEAVEWGYGLISFGYNLIIIFFIAIFARRKLPLIIAITLAIPILFINLSGFYDDSYGMQTFRLMLSMVLNSYVILVLLRELFTVKRVDLNVLSGAALVYILLGFLWALFYTYLEITQPGSFTGIAEVVREHNLYQQIIDRFERFLYYSFVTLTTLGYGNIYPKNLPASALSSAQAVLGQLYLTILMARLIGFHIKDAIKQD